MPMYMYCTSVTFLNYCRNISLRSMVRKYLKCKCNGIMQILFLPWKSDQPNAHNFKCLDGVLSESLSQSQDEESDCSGSLLGLEAAPGVDIQLPQPHSLAPDKVW